MGPYEMVGESGGVQSGLLFGVDTPLKKRSMAHTLLVPLSCKALAKAN